MDVGLFAIRVAVGLALAGHGTQKLFGWFEGSGLRGSARNFAKLGYPAAPVMAWLAALSETLGGLGLALGVLTPLSSAAAFGVMLNAIAAHRGKGPWNRNGGWEYPLVLATVSGGLGFTGPGRLSLDALTGLPLGGLLPGLLAIAVGALAAVVLLALRRPPGASSSQTGRQTGQDTSAGSARTKQSARV